MAKIAFLDQSFHAKTKSSNFFYDLLATRHDVHAYYLENDAVSQAKDIASVGYDIIVCFQTDNLAPYFIATGHRVICVPMFDGSGSMSNYYWTFMKQARFVNFSKLLHDNLKRIGMNSMYAQYYLDPSRFTPVEDYKTRRFFFWQRRPEHGFDSNFASKFMAIGDSIHFHNAPDVLSAGDWEPSFGTCSYFNEQNSNAYSAALSKSNIFICPRSCEGIGMSMLEALARGMCVIGHTFVTANEYIQHDVDGVLVNYQDPKVHKLKPKYIQFLAKNARTRAIKGYDKWLKIKEDILFYIETTPRPRVSKVSEKTLDEFLVNSKNFSERRATYNKNLRKFSVLQHKLSINNDESALGKINHWLKRYWLWKRFQSITKSIYRLF